MSPATSSPASQSAQSILAFRIGLHHYTLPVALVRETVLVDRSVSVPRSPSAVVGLFSLRGSPLCVIDTAALLEIGLPPATRRTALVLIRGSTAICALTIDAVLGVQPLDEERFQPRRAGHDSEAVFGMLELAGGQVATVLEPDVLLRRIDALRFR